MKTWMLAGLLALALGNAAGGVEKLDVLADGQRLPPGMVDLYGAQLPDGSGAPRKMVFATWRDRATDRPIFVQVVRGAPMPREERGARQYMTDICVYAESIKEPLLLQGGGDDNMTVCCDEEPCPSVPRDFPAPTPRAASAAANRDDNSHAVADIVSALRHVTCRP